MTDVTVTQADFAKAATQLGYPPDITRADIFYWDGGTKLAAVEKRAKELADYRGAGEDAVETVARAALSQSEGAK